jgi:FixJ family two-component response regulator
MPRRTPVENQDLLHALRQDSTERALERAEKSERTDEEQAEFRKNFQALVRKQRRAVWK